MAEEKTARERLVEALTDIAREAQRKADAAAAENRRLHGAYLAAEAAVAPAQRAWSEACGKMRAAQHEAEKAWEQVDEVRRARG